MATTKRRSGLGRGLDSLLPSQRAEVALEDSALREVPVDAVTPNPRQPREVFDEESIADLAASVEQLGILQPLLVRDSGDGRYELIAGERRLRAARGAGLDTVPVLLVETDDRGSLERALVENVHREDLDPLEEAAAYRALMDEGGLTQEVLGQRLGRSQPTISNTLRLLDLPTPIQKMVHDRRLTGGHARALLALQGHPMQERAAWSVVTDDLSVRATEALVRRYQNRFGSSTDPKPPTSRPALAIETERTLKDRLQTKVRVEVTKRKRRIIIDAASDEDLARIAAIISGHQSGGATTTVSPK